MTKSVFCRTLKKDKKSKEEEMRKKVFFMLVLVFCASSIFAQTNTWTGAFNYYWHNNNNWSLGHIPTLAEDVVITDDGYAPPNIAIYDEECNSVTIESGAELIITDKQLTISGNLDVYGTLTMNNTSGSLTVNNNVTWYSGSSGSMTGSAVIYVQGIWEFKDGANVYLNGGYVDFFGAGISYIRSKDADSHFNHVRNNKSGTSLTLSAQSTQTCQINGNLYIYNNCLFSTASSQSIKIGNFVNNMSGMIQLSNGTFIFGGISGGSSFQAGDYFNNVTINSSGTTTFNNDIDIRGNLTIESGALSPGSNTIFVDGNWTNNVGTAGFLEGTGKVVFDGGNYHQYCSDETFNLLEINKSLGGAFRANGTDVTCASYNWVGGALDVLNGGTFTADDLVQNGIYGIYYLNPDCAINLTNSDGYIDLNGELNINGGNFNIYGGTSDSYWTYALGATINMSDGVLDFIDRGIYVYNSANSLTTNITGGTIRTSKNFRCARADFTPAAGTIELYGLTDSNIQQDAGSLYQVTINKAVAARNDTNDSTDYLSYDNRTGEQLPAGTRANTVSLSNNLSITGQMIIETGTFAIGPYTCNIGSHLDVYGTLAFTDADATLNVDGSVIWRNGSTEIIDQGFINVKSNWTFMPGCDVTIGIGNTVDFIGTSNQYFVVYGDGNHLGNVVISPSLGVLGRVVAIHDSSLYPLHIAGNLVVDFSETMPLNRAFELTTGTSVIVDGELDLSWLMDISDSASATITGDVTFPETGILRLDNGSFTCNYFNPTGFTTLDGELIMNDGSVFAFPFRSVSIGTSFTNTITGGTLQFGRTLNATGLGNFQLTAGTVEFVTDNTGHYINVLNGNYLNNISVKKVSGWILANNNFEAQGNVTIDSGMLACNDKTISVGGNWTNNVGTSGFNEGTGTVIFNGGNYHQYCSDETFNTLEINKPAGGFLQVDGSTISCANYDWTAGGIEASSGTFTALDLVDNGLFGSYFTSGTGVINLYQDGSQYVHLNGVLNISGGTINVHGGAVISVWPIAADAEITMSDGVLDFKDTGIFIYDSPTYHLSSNITGGTIRTAGRLEGQRADFTPAGGIFELYGSGDGWITQGNGCTFHHININKSGAKETENLSAAKYSERFRNVIPTGTRANSITMSSNITLTGDLDISGGTFSLDTFSCNVAGTTSIYGTLVMNSNLNDFTSHELYWYNGSIANVTEGTFHVDIWGFYEGTNANLGINNTAFVGGMYYPTDDDASFGNLVVVSSAKTFETNSKTYYPLRVDGNFTIQSGANWQFVNSNSDLIVSGYATIESGSFLRFSSADFMVAGELDISGTLTIVNGSAVTISGDVTFPSTGTIAIEDGSFICNSNTEGFTSLEGNLSMESDSILEFSGKNVFIGATFVNNILGGTLRFGRSFFAQDATNFQLNAGTVEFFTSNSGHYMNIINGNYLYNLTVNKPSSSVLVYDNLTVKNNVLIEAGTLSASDKILTVGGNWTNEVGTSGFSESSSWVIFNGTADQNCSTETFNFLEIDKSSGNLVIPVSSEVTCAVYDWTSGGISVTGGTFIADDLADTGVYGNYTLTSGAINLIQDTSQFSDLNGNLDISGGTMTITGGDGLSYWSYGGNCNLTMSAGILDFVDNGIDVYSSAHSFAENITGGIIRTNGDFVVENANFTPSGGTIELYGGTDAVVQNLLGTNYHNLHINKSGRNDITTKIRKRRDGTIIKKDRANSATIYSDISVNNLLTIDAGTFDLNGYVVSAYNDVSINDGGTMEIYDDSRLLMDNGTTISVTNNGTLKVIGSVLGNAAISRISAGYYGFDIENGGTIAADYATFEYMDADGVNLQSGSIVDAVASFHNCTFRNGIANGALMKINNAQDFEINNAVFPANTWGGDFNVYKSVDAGNVLFLEQTGDFSGSDYEYDPNNRIDWSVPAPENVGIQITSEYVVITWDEVIGATSYKIESCDTPNGTFTEDLTGSFYESEMLWYTTIPASPKFYQVKAIK
jgi:hypothetical protein